MGRKHGREEGQMGQPVVPAPRECRPSFQEDTCLFPHHPPSPLGQAQANLLPILPPVQEASLLTSFHQNRPPGLLHSLAVSPPPNLFHDGAECSSPFPQGPTLLLIMGLEPTRLGRRGCDQTTFPWGLGGRSFPQAHPKDIHINRGALSILDQDKQRPQLILAWAQTTAAGHVKSLPVPGPGRSGGTVS